MLDLSYMIWDMKTEERRNRFTGEREFLTVEEQQTYMIKYFIMKHSKNGRTCRSVWTSLVDLIQRLI